MVFAGGLALILLAAGCSSDDPPVQPATPEAGLAQTELQGLNPNPGVIPAGSMPLGKSYGEWSRLWWQWLISIPIDENPGLDTDGSFVALNQSGQVWFLAPNYAQGQVDVRYATIPAGKMLFIDIAALVGSPAIGDPEDPDALRQVLTEAVDAIVEIVFEVDGRALQDMESYRVQSPLFTLEFPEDNVFGVVPGTYYPSAAEGYYAMLAPLSCGEHVIHIYTNFGPIFGTSEVTFHLTVEGRQQGRKPAS
jgi:hypothetical protein